MSVFKDALDLRTAVAEAIGSTAFVDAWPRIVGMAETRINRELRTRAMIKVAATSVVNGAADLPADFIEALGIYAAGAEITGNPATRLASGSYSFDGGMRGPNGPVVLEYYAKVPTLADDLSASNWLLEQYPDLYLYACAAEAAKQQRDIATMQALQSMRDNALIEVRSDDHAARYSRTRIRMVGPTP